jgi:hypothetical protein
MRSLPAAARSRRPLGAPAVRGGRLSAGASSAQAGNAFEGRGHRGRSLRTTACPGGAGWAQGERRMLTGATLSFCSGASTSSLAQGSDASLGRLSPDSACEEARRHRCRSRAPMSQLATSCLQPARPPDTRWREPFAWAPRIPPGPGPCSRHCRGTRTTASLLPRALPAMLRADRGVDRIRSCSGRSMLRRWVSAAASTAVQLLERGRGCRDRRA